MYRLGATWHQAIADYDLRTGENEQKKNNIVRSTVQYIQKISFNSHNKSLPLR